MKPSTVTFTSAILERAVVDGIKRTPQPPAGGGSLYAEMSGRGRLPSNGTQRRMRLRLTRQRASPSRVRARERAEEPESGLSLGRFNLLALGTVVAIVVSIGGLAATAVGTISSARVAADQLEQSREQAEEKQREQAA